MAQRKQKVRSVSVSLAKLGSGNPSFVLLFAKLRVVKPGTEPESILGRGQAVKA
jgi:hypothetical protein